MGIYHFARTRKLVQQDPFPNSGDTSNRKRRPVIAAGEKRARLTFGGDPADRVAATASSSVQADSRLARALVRHNRHDGEIYTGGALRLDAAGSLRHTLRHCAMTEEDNAFRPRHSQAPELDTGDEQGSDLKKTSTARVGPRRKFEVIAERLTVFGEVGT